MSSPLMCHPPSKRPEPIATRTTAASLLGPQLTVPMLPALHSTGMSPMNLFTLSSKNVIFWIKVSKNTWKHTCNAYHGRIPPRTAVDGADASSAAQHRHVSSEFIYYIIRRTLFSGSKYPKILGNILATRTTAASPLGPQLTVLTLPALHSTGMSPM